MPTIAAHLGYPKKREERGTAPVSYTHLDVYKRQDVIYLLIIRLNSIDHIVITLQLCYLPRTSHCTVSYTHLDVYKRQFTHLIAFF